MNKTHVITNTLFAVFCAALINKTSYAEPTNISLLKTEIKTYHDSGLYQKELSHVLSRADAFIIQRARQNKHQAHPQKLAIVLDIDETCLSNYNNIIKRDFSADPKTLNQEVLAANAPAIKPMLSLYHDALKQDVSVFFVTGRVKSQEHATQKNLRREGFTTWRGLYLRENNHHQPSAIPFKTQTRANITQQGYTIIASIGDQDSDLKGGYAEKTFKLPNPYYYLP